MQSKNVRPKMHRRSIIDDKLPSITWQITLAIAILVAAAFNIAGLSVRVDLSANIVAIISGYTFLTIYFRFIRQNAAIARALISFGQLTTVILMGIMLSYAASAVPLPYRDAELYAMDRWLGFDRDTYIAFLRRNDGLLNVLTFAYNTMMHQNILVLLVAMVTRRIDRLQAYIVAFAIAVTVTAAIASFIPVANAMIYVDKVPTGLSTLPDGGHSYFPTLEGLRNGTLRIIDFNYLEGLISFPSFHTVNAFLFVWALWPMRTLRVVLVPLNLLLIASTPLCGAHYVADIIGGAAVAFGAIVATAWLIRMPLANERLAGLATAS
jgi:membrane-associated phospholipid phosphatase